MSTKYFEKNGNICTVGRKPNKSGQRQLYFKKGNGPKGGEYTDEDELISSGYNPLENSPKNANNKNFQKSLVGYSKTGSNNTFYIKKSYLGPIEPSQKAKKIYRATFGDDFADDFFLSQDRFDHSMYRHGELDYDDVVYCINNPNIITEVKKNEQVNIISILPNGKYACILVDAKLNKKSEKTFNKNGILSARYLSHDKLEKETKRHKKIFENIDIPE